MVEPDLRRSAGATLITPGGATSAVARATLVASGPDDRHLVAGRAQAVLVADHTGHVFVQRHEPVVHAVDKALRGEEVPGFDGNRSVPTFAPDLEYIMTGRLRDTLEEFSQHIKEYIH